MDKSLKVGENEWSEKERKSMKYYALDDANGIVGGNQQYAWNMSMTKI